MVPFTPGLPPSAPTYREFLTPGGGTGGLQVAPASTYQGTGLPVPGGGNPFEPTIPAMTPESGALVPFPINLEGTQILHQVQVEGLTAGLRPGQGGAAFVDF